MKIVVKGSVRMRYCYNKSLKDRIIGVKELCSIFIVRRFVCFLSVLDHRLDVLTSGAVLEENIWGHCPPPKSSAEWRAPRIEAQKVSPPHSTRGSRGVS